MTNTAQRIPADSPKSATLDRVERALEEFAAGHPVVVLDAKDRENEADLIMAAEFASADVLGFFVRHTSGVLCAAMEPDRLGALGLPLMVAENAESMRTAFTVTVDAAEGITTGISAADRTRTLRVLADPASTRENLVRPGHIFPLRAREGGVLERPGHTEAGVDLCRLSGRTPVAVLAELVSDEGPVLRAPAAEAFAEKHNLAVISIAELVAYRRRHEPLVGRTAPTYLPTDHGRLTAYGFRAHIDGQGVAGNEHLALVAGEPTQADEVLVRIHSECLTGDVFGSRRCDCGPQLESALAEIGKAGTGVLIYLRGHEGRGIGLLPKLEAYALQDRGSDTVDANLALGLPIDARDYWVAAQILTDLGIRKVRLLTNNPAKRSGLESYGINVVGTEPLLIDPNPDNQLYLATKRDRLGHQIPEQSSTVQTGVRA